MHLHVQNAKERSKRKIVQTAELIVCFNYIFWKTLACCTKHTPSKKVYLMFIILMNSPRALAKIYFCFIKSCFYTI